MSIKIMSQVWENGPEDQGDLLVLLVLADFANDNGECWPSMKAVAEKARMTDRGARKAIRRLEENGFVATEVNRGRGACNRYTVKPERGSRNTVPVKEKNRNLTTLKPELDDTKTGTGVPPEPSKNHQGTVTNTSNGDDADFDAFWAVVPRRVGKGKARTAFRAAIKKASPQVITDAMRQFSESVKGKDPKFIPHPATWLNGERWEDEPETKGPSNAVSLAQRAAARARGMDSGQSSNAVVPLLPARNRS